MTPGRRVVLRADGSTAVGLGHLMRVLTLGQAMQRRGWCVTLASAEVPDSLLAHARERSIGFHRLQAGPGGSDDARELVALDPDLVVVDGYQFDAPFYEVLRAASRAHVVVDDDGDTPAVAPVAVVNHNAHAHRGLYDRLVGEPRLLLGLEHALLRPEIAAGGSAPGRGRVVFVALGGSDVLGLSPALAEELVARGVAVRVALGAAVHGRGEVARRLADLPGVELVDPERFARALASSAVAVVGAGVTMWEAAHLGAPVVAVVATDGQVQAAGGAVAAGFARQVDLRTGPDAAAVVSEVLELLADDEARSAMEAAGRAAVDGRGAERVVVALEALVR